VAAGVSPVVGVSADDAAQVYERHAGELTRFATAMVGRDDARDVVAAAMVRCLFRRTGPPVENVRAYLFRAVYHESVSVQRQVARRLRLVGRLGAERSPEGDPVIGDRLAGALERLSRRQRAAIVLTYWQDLEPPQVADRLGISEGAVRKHLARARQNLRTFLGEEVGHE
jgi:RNA polymerase sigma factor (sigma-70 family)